MNLTSLYLKTFERDTFDNHHSPWHHQGRLTITPRLLIFNKTPLNSPSDISHHMNHGKSTKLTEQLDKYNNIQIQEEDNL
jgi:hypothetical protein